MYPNALVYLYNFLHVDRYSSRAYKEEPFLGIVHRNARDVAFMASPNRERVLVIGWQRCQHHRPEVAVPGSDRYSVHDDDHEPASGTTPVGDGDVDGGYVHVGSQRAVRFDRASTRATLAADGVGRVHAVVWIPYQQLGVTDADRCDLRCRHDLVCALPSNAPSSTPPKAMWITPVNGWAFPLVVWIVPPRKVSFTRIRRHVVSLDWRS